MKLELKHLAPYLPYNLMIQRQTHGEIAEMSCVTETSVNITSRNFQFGMWADIFEIKPILRPLSDLTKLGDDDVKITEHTINQILGYGDVMFEHYKGDLDITIEGEFAQTYDSSKTVSFKTFETIRNELLKGHYDIFGLIENNLAIDINTLNKQL